MDTVDGDGCGSGKSSAATLDEHLIEEEKNLRGCRDKGMAVAAEVCRSAQRPSATGNSGRRVCTGRRTGTSMLRRRSVGHRDSRRRDNVRDDEDDDGGARDSCAIAGRVCAEMLIASGAAQPAAAMISAAVAEHHTCEIATIARSEKAR